MKTTLVGLAVALLLCLPGSVCADEPGLDRMQKQVEQLERAIEGLLNRIASLEATIARLKGLPAPEGQSGTSEAAPPAGAARPVADSPIEEKYDRFTGRRTLRIRSASLQAMHKDDAADRIEVQARWQVEKEGANAPTYELFLETCSKVRRWPKDSVVYVLTDGDRRRTVVAGMIEQRGPRYIEYIVLGFDQEAAARFVSAKKLEIRAGDWQLEIPAHFRALAVRVNERMDQSADR